MVAQHVPGYLRVGRGTNKSDADFVTTNFFSTYTLPRIKPSERKMYGYAIELMDTVPGWSQQDALDAFDADFQNRPMLAVLGREVVEAAWNLGRPSPLRTPHVPTDGPGRRHVIPEDPLGALHPRWSVLQGLVHTVRQDLPCQDAVGEVVRRMGILDQERHRRGLADVVTLTMCFLYPFLRPWEVRYLRDKAPNGLPRSSQARAAVILFDRLREAHGAPASLRSMLAVQTRWEGDDHGPSPVFARIGARGVYALGVNANRYADTPALRATYKA